MHVISEHMKPDIAAGQWFRVTVPAIPLVIEARDHAGGVRLRPHLGNRGNTAEQDLVIEAVVPRLDMFCVQLGFQVNDLVWRCRKDVELEGLVEETATVTSPEKFSEAQRSLMRRGELQHSAQPLSTLTGEEEL